ncbi:MAG TPA: hypothetical protein VN719_09650 [Gemmatimonadales bacterium]|nr:hypothetical protein [Gemmatimonadales bacterium]
MAIEDFMDDLVNVLAQATGQDTTGAPSRKPYSLAAANCPALVQEKGGSRDRKNDKATQTLIGTVYLTTDYQLTTRNRLELIDPNAPDAPKRELVITAAKNINRMNRLWQVDYEEQRV